MKNPHSNPTPTLANDQTATKRIEDISWGNIVSASQERLLKSLRAISSTPKYRAQLKGGNKRLGSFERTGKDSDGYGDCTDWKRLWGKTRSLCFRVWRLVPSNAQHAIVFFAVRLQHKPVRLCPESHWNERRRVRQK